jgi:hypothetical protein
MGTTVAVIGLGRWVSRWYATCSRPASMSWYATWTSRRVQPLGRLAHVLDVDEKEAVGALECIRSGDVELVAVREV